MAIPVNGNRAYVGNVSTNSVSVIDTVAETVVATVIVGRIPQGVPVIPDGWKAYVENNGSKRFL